MIETKDKLIDGSNYTVTQLPARRALRLKAKLLKMFGSVIAQFFLATSEDNNEEQKKFDFVKTFQLLGSQIDENSFESLITEILTGVRKNGIELTAQTIDIEFAGDIATIYKVVWFVLEANFGNFFQMIGIGNLSGDVQQPISDLKKTYTRN